MSDSKYNNEFYTDSNHSLTVQEKIKLLTSIPSYVKTPSASRDLFDVKRKLMNERELLERELLHQQELSEKRKYLEDRRFMDDPKLFEVRNLNISNMGRRHLLDQTTAAHNRSLIPGCLGDIRGKTLNDMWVNVPSKTINKCQTTIHPAVEKWFTSMDTKNEGRISSKELQQAFEIFQGRRFSDGACKFVVRIFDLDKNGGLDIKEFETLYYHIKLWINAFNAMDKNGTGFLDENELDHALRILDINFSRDFIKFLITKNNPEAKRISLDQYIVTCIQIQKFTDEFKNRDPNYTGSIKIKYEEFLEMILRCL